MAFSENQLRIYEAEEELRKAGFSEEQVQVLSKLYLTILMSLQIH